MSANRFITLARQGRHPGASTGEKVCHRLAKSLHQIGDDMALIDSEALEGFHELCRFASGPWPTDDAKQTVFRTISQAAGKA